MKIKLTFIVAFFLCLNAIAGTYQTITLQQNDAFRWDVMQYVQKELIHSDSQLGKALDARWFNGGSAKFYLIRWSAKVGIYLNGNLVGEGAAVEPSLSKTLSSAAQTAFHVSHLNKAQLKNARIKITFYYPPDNRQYSMISDKNNPNWALELIGNEIPVRQMDTTLLRDRINLEKAYLLRVMDPEIHAFFKRYSAGKDKKEPRLRTIYTASSLYTLLKVNEVSPDPEIKKQIEPIADFILSMQEQTGKDAGAFHYAYEKLTHKKDYRFIVGTVSKTIFTLLLLYDQTHDQKYLDSAQKAGDWLIQRVGTDGHVDPIVKRVNGKDIQETKQSFLYSGQVLSALSRLYAATNQQSYYETATKIANKMIKAVKEKGSFVGDSYRAPNSVTTSWVVMGLVDYAKINPAPRYRSTITNCAKALVQHQINAPWDAFNEGRLMDIITTSGNGWVNEVMTVLYPLCKTQKMPGCASYKQFIVHSSRWLVQSVYTSQNMFAIKNPSMTEGGVMRNFAQRVVRTDAVCHGLNGLVGLLNIVGPDNQMLQFLPERPIDEVIGLLEMGGRGVNAFHKNP